jgi:hypothetical protein
MGEFSAVCESLPRTKNTHTHTHTHTNSHSQVDAVRAIGIAGNTSIPSLQHPPFLCLVGTPLGADESNIC